MRHKFILSESNFNKTKYLKEQFNIIMRSKTKTNNLDFVVMLESKNLPIWISMIHPEKAPY